MNRTTRVLGAALLAALACSVSCVFGPSEQRLGCLNGCAREKDHCMLDAMTSQGIASCDAHGRDCTQTCPE